VTPTESSDGLSREEFERRLQRIAELARSDASINIETSETIARANQDRDRRLKIIHDELDPLLEQEWRYVDEHPELFDKSKDVVFPDVILTRTASTRHTIPDAKLLIKTLRTLGEGAVVEIKETVSVAALKAKKGLIEKLRATTPNVVESKPMWNYRLTFRPKDTASEAGGIPKPETHEAPRNVSD
jgi:hypothetical protein